MAVEHAILACELCIRMQPQDGLVHALAQQVKAHPYTVGMKHKWKFYRDCVSLLLPRLGDLHRGCWDFFDDDGRAKRDHQMWFDGMATEEGVRPGPSGAIDPYRGEPRFFTFTMSFLLMEDTQTTAMLRRVCNIPEPKLWQRATFLMILRAIPAMSFSAVKSDVIYLIPRDLDWGLTAGDLEHPKFKYLRPVV